MTVKFPQKFANKIPGHGLPERAVKSRLEDSPQTSFQFSVFSWEIITEN
jgi:hypothetical protein